MPIQSSKAYQAHAMEKGKQIQHLYNRAGFGIHPVTVHKLRTKDRSVIIDELFSASRDAKALAAVGDPREKDKDVSNLKVGLLFLRSRKELIDLNVGWMHRMSTDKAQLREKMTLFWHDHFATHIPIAYMMQIQNNTIRGNALENFGDLLHAISKDPAMILYLNNQQNRKKSPNENFAREVMELFTLGEGNYTETDIKEAARAFTGWSIDKQGKFVFNKNVHDFGSKTFFGRTGNFTGEDIINIILEQKQTARYITEKIYRFFVHPVADDKVIEGLATDFYNSGYDIASLMKSIFNSEWFYKSKNAGALIKSPTELIVNFKRLLKAEFKNENYIVYSQKALGQILFFPPNVAGWPGYKSWIDSSTLITRMKLPLVLFASEVYDLTVKPEYEQMGEELSADAKRRLRWFGAKVNWTHFVSKYKSIGDNELAGEIVNDLIAGSDHNIDLEMLMQFADHSNKESLIRSLVIRVMALPEFQLV